MYEVLVSYVEGASENYKAYEVSHSEVAMCLMLGETEHMYIPYTAVKWWKVKKMTKPGIIKPKGGIIHG